MDKLIIESRIITTKVTKTKQPKCQSNAHEKTNINVKKNIYYYKNKAKVSKTSNGLGFRVCQVIRQIGEYNVAQFMQLREISIYHLNEASPLYSRESQAP